MNEFIPVNELLLDGNEKKYLMECIDTGWISSEGPFVKKLEEDFAKKVGRKFGIVVCNGSAALDIAAIALGLGKDDEVIMPTFTIISCAAAIIRTGAKPILVDSDAITWNMDVDQIEEKISSKTKAIMIVHIYGLPADVNPVLKLAEKYGLKILEDAAEMHGQTYYGKSCGSFGDISIFSFYPNKHVTTGEGGIIVTDDEQLAEKCRSLRNLCFKKERRFVHHELGFNYRMSNLQAAVGVAQLEKLDEHIKKKQKIGKFYTKNLKSLSYLQLPFEKTDYAQNIYWVYGIILKDFVGFNAMKAMKMLGEKGIGARPFFWCMHEQPVFMKMGLFKNEKYPVAEKLARQGFYIPSGLGLTESKMEQVVQKMKECFHECL